MLLRASHLSGAFTKEAGMIGSALGGIGRFTQGMASGALGPMAKKWISPTALQNVPKGVMGAAGKATGAVLRHGAVPIGAVGLGTAVAAPMVAQGVRSAQAGLSPEYLQASRMRGMPVAPGQY